MFCHSCGAQVPGTAQYCQACGQPLAPGPAAVVPYVPPAGIQARSGHWISEGWLIVSGDIWMFALLAIVFSILNSVVPIILQGPMFIGMHIYCVKRMMGRQAEFADLFRGFDYFIPGLVASLLIWLFTGAAALLCLIPGLIVAAMYKFTYLFIFDKRMDFWPAMQASHNIVRGDYFGFTIFLLALAGVNLLGALCCIVGVLVSVPVTMAAITVAYQEIVGFDQRTVDTLG